MLETVIKTGIIFYVMGITMAIGILAKVISHLTARKMVKAASEIQKSNHRLMRLVKAKFEHASMVSDKVQNVEAFVKKYLYEYKVLGVRLDTWRGMPVKMLWLTMAVGIIGVLSSYQVKGMGETTFQYASFAGIFGVILFSIHILNDEKTKLEAAKNYMVDYLENVCVHRYEKANKEAQMAQSAEIPENEIAGDENMVNRVVENASVAQGTAESNSIENPTPQPDALKEREEQEMRIRAILEEFLA